MKLINKIKIIIETYKKNIVMGGVILLILILYIIGKRQDRQVIIYEQPHDDAPKVSKIIENEGSIYQKKEKLLNSKLDILEKKLEQLSQDIQLKQEIDVETQEEPEREVEVEKVEQSKEVEVEYQQLPRPVVYETVAPQAPNIINFPVKRKDKGEYSDEYTVTIPSGSFVKAKLLTGVEAAESRPLPVLLQADYAFIGPNKSKIDLSGCFMIAKSMGNLSTERVEMQANKLSCVGKSGRMFERNINGFIADDKDNSFAVMGEVNSKQGRVAAMAFLSSIVEGVSKAVSQAQSSVISNPLGAPSQMITGDQSKFIAAEGAGNAASSITQWYLKHAEGLLPTINIGSGANVWIVLQEATQLPNWYFRKIPNNYGSINFLTNLMEHN